MALPKPFATARPAPRPKYGRGAVDTATARNRGYTDARHSTAVDPKTGQILATGGAAGGGHGQVRDGSYDATLGLIGGGGRAETQDGQPVDPNQLPAWDPLNRSLGVQTSYLNLLRRPSDATAGTRGEIAGALFPALRDSAQPRSMPGAGALAASRSAQVGAAGTVARSGQPARNEVGSIMREGRQVGQREDQGQAALDEALFAQAMGTGGPTAAQSLFGGAVDRNIRTQRALAQGVRGGSAAAAMRQGTRAGVQLGLESQQQAAALRAQEQQAAQGLLSQNLQVGRAQDLQTLGTRADIAGQAGRDSLARDTAVAEILAQIRGQDLGTSELGLKGRSLDDQKQLQLLAQALGLGDLELSGGTADANTLLQAFQAMDASLQNRRETNLGKPSRFQQQIGDIGAGMNVVGKGAATVGSTIGGGMGKR